MLRFLTAPLKPVLKQVKVAACCANTDFLLDKSTHESRHTRESRNLLQNKFALGWLNVQHVQILLQKVELLPSFCNNFSQLATGLNVAGKTQNIAFTKQAAHFCYPFHRTSTAPFLQHLKTVVPLHFLENVNENIDRRSFLLPHSFNKFWVASSGSNPKF